MICLSNRHRTLLTDMASHQFLKEGECKRIFALISRQSRFITSPIHGLHHWQTVERNGHYLSQYTGANVKVISYFAYFHDCMRENEDIDPKHGYRGAMFAVAHKNQLGLTETQFEMLMRACKGHTYGRKTACPTVATCWDADRLDIGRVGITPNSSYLFSDEAKRITEGNDFIVLESYRKVSMDCSFHEL